MKVKLPLWWAYLDDQGVIRVKKYVSDRAIQNCEQLPFCKGIFEPFPAVNYLDAQDKIKQFLDLEQADQVNKKKIIT